MYKRLFKYNSMDGPDNFKVLKYYCHSCYIDSNMSDKKIDSVK